MMNRGQSSGTEPVIIDLDSDSPMDFETLINNYMSWDDSDVGATADDMLINPNLMPVIDDTTMNQNHSSQPLMPIAYANTNFGEGSSNLMPSNQLLPSRPMFNYTHRGNAQSDQTPWVQMQQPTTPQEQLPSQRVTRTSNGQCELRAPQQFSSSHEYREYVASQIIPVMREKYYIKLQDMFNNETLQHAKARTLEDSKKHKAMITYLERMLKFLSITKASSIPGNDRSVSNYVNALVKFMEKRMGDRSGGSSQNCEAVNAPSMQLPSQSQMATNVETNIVNFNQNFNSRIPVTQQLRMPSSFNNTSSQIGINRRPENSIRIGPSIISTSTGLVLKQQTNSGPNTSSVIGSGSPIGFFSNPPAANLSSQPTDRQPRFSNSEKMKQPMHATNKYTHPRVRAGLSPLGPRLVNHYPPSQLPVPSSVKPMTSQSFNANSMLTLQTIARSPFLFSSSSTAPSGTPLSTTVEKQKLATPTGTAHQGPQTSKDPIHHLAQVVKSMSPKALSSSLADISAMEKAENTIPERTPTNLFGQYINIEDTDDETCPCKRREVSTIPSMLNQQFDLPEGSSQTTSNQKLKLKNEWALREEIKEINNKLLETIVYEVVDSSKDDIILVGGHDGTILKCLFRNVRFRDFPSPKESTSTEKMSEFAVLFLLPFDYPESSIRVFEAGRDLFNCEQRWTMYEDMITKFNTASRAIPGNLCVKELAIIWDASASAVMTEFSQKVGAKSLNDRYGTWESCPNGSSGTS